jgi:hypothetical protein
MTWLSMSLGLVLAVPPSEADRLFAKGREMMKKHPVEACRLFEKSFELEPALGALLNLALCFESIDRPASAWTSFNHAKEWAERTHESDRAALADKHIQRLAPRLSWIAITASEPVPGLEIVLDGEVVPYRAPWSAPVDPGPHVLAASARGYEGWQTSLVAPQPGQSAPAVVPALEPELEKELAETRLEPQPAPQLVPVPLDAHAVAATTGISTAQPASRPLPLLAVFGGSALVAGGGVALAWSVDVWTRAQSQRLGQTVAPSPSSTAVTRAQFDTARALYPVSVMAIGVGALAAGLGAWGLARTPVAVTIVPSANATVLVAAGVL